MKTKFLLMILVILALGAGHSGDVEARRWRRN